MARGRSRPMARTDRDLPGIAHRPECTRQPLRWLRAPKGLHLRNTLTRQVEPIEPNEPGLVGMYTCGPTVYRWAHVGNLRTYLLADLIRRTLLYHGLTVLHVKNITDVGHLRDERFDRGEDRMLVQAQLESKSSAEIAAVYEAGFHHDEGLVNILPAHVYPRATEHIPEMVALAERLEDAGHAYATAAGTVYYAVGSFPGYGRLSGNTLDQLRAGHRVEVEPDKRDPADFALWKPAGEGRQLKWSTARWGAGFPGWHLECSAMGLRYLGPLFDIHTGGVDNIFPHHEDEIAQSAALSGRPPARYWVHGEHLLSGGRKMAKSAGNFQRITELAADGSDPLAFRYLAMTVHYSRKQNLSDASIAGARIALASLRARLRALGPPPPAGPWAAPAILHAGAAGDRPVGIAAGVAGHGTVPAVAAYPVTDRAGSTAGSRCRPRGRCRRPAPSSISASSQRSTTTWTCLGRSPLCANATRRPLVRRTPLARPGRGRDPGTRSGPGMGQRGSRSGRDAGRRDRVSGGGPATAGRAGRRAHGPQFQPSRRAQDRAPCPGHRGNRSAGRDHRPPDRSLRLSRRPAATR